MCVWQRIVSNQGGEFRTKSGLEFHYEVSGNTVFVSRTDKRQLSKSDFEKALGLGPLEGPGEINDLVQGPAYVWAVLNDARVKGG